MKALRCFALTVAALLAVQSQSVESASPQQAANLQGKKWVLLRFTDSVTDLLTESFVRGHKRPTLTFEANRFFGHDGCNAFGGSYTATATTLNIGEHDVTDKGCNKQASARAKAYLNALERVASYRVKDEFIELRNVKGQTTTYRSKNEHLELQDARGRSILVFTEANDHYRMTLQLKAATKVYLDERSRVRVGIWGYDVWVADAPSTKLKDQVFDFPSLEVRPSVAFTEEDFLQVEYLGGVEGMMYYVTFAVDADGDDRICVGDYRQDYDQTEMEAAFFSKGDVGQQNVSIYIKEITDLTECEDF